MSTFDVTDQPTIALASRGVVPGSRLSYPACLEQPNAGNTFAGSLVAQTWNDLPLWEEFLNRYPVRSIVELGTFRGGMAIFLALQAGARQVRFVTMDANLDQIENPQLLKALGATVVSANLFEESAVLAMGELLEELPKPVLLFSDNGNKREEVRRFAPLLQVGDYLAIHDWGSEISAADIPPKMDLVWPEPPEASRLTRWFLVA